MIVKGFGKKFRPLLHQSQIRPEISAAGAVYGVAVTALGQRPAQDFVSSIPTLVEGAKGGPWSTFGTYMDLGTPRPQQPAPGAPPANGERQIVAPDQAAATTKAAGRMGDTELVHINREELEELRGQWGEPTINPQTGLPEFFVKSLKKKLKKLWKKIDKAPVGHPLHGIKHGVKIHELMSPTVHINDRIHNLRKNGASADHVKWSIKDLNHNIQDAFKTGWPALAFFVAWGAGGAFGGGAAAGGASSAASGTAGAAGGAAGATAGGAAAAGMETVTVVGSAGAGAAEGAAALGAAAGMAASPTATPASSPQASTPTQPTTQQPSKGMLGKAMDGWSSLSFSEKLLVSKMGVDMVTGLISPKEEDLLAKSKTWQGAFYGHTAESAEKAPAPAAGAAPAAAPSSAPAAATKPRSLVSAAPSAPQQAGAERSILPPQLRTASAPPPPPKRLAELNPAEEGDSVFQSRAPGVRYIA